MACFVRCTNAEGRGEDVWINVDRVQDLRRVPASGASTFSNARPESTRVWFSSHGTDVLGGWDVVYVLEDPATIVSRTREG